MFRFEQLDIWHLAIVYAKSLYILIANFPKTETFALSDQIRRAAVSISNNIAEGSGGTDKDFAKYIDIAVKSALETVSCLSMAFELKYITQSEKDKLYIEAEVLIKRMRAFKNSLHIVS